VHVNAMRMAWLVAGMLVAGVGCSDHPRAVEWVTTGDRAAFPSSLTVDQATAISANLSYVYWITADGFLYRAPRAGGEVGRVPLPASGARIAVHDDIYVGWTDDSGNTVIADIDPPSGAVTVANQQAGALRGLVAGKRGYSFASPAPDGTLVQTCLRGVCPQPAHIESDYKSLALDLTTETFYVLTVDGLRTCTVSGGCPATADATPAATTLVWALPDTYFLLDSNGQVFGEGGSSMLGSAAAPSPTKIMVDDGNGLNPNPVGTWSNGSQLAQGVLVPGATTTELAVACTDFDLDATGRPIYCLVGSSTIQVIP
jgi:hypothetical protein